jgi:hypothetical protein
MFLKQTTERVPRKLITVHSLYVMQKWPLTGGIMVRHHDILWAVEENSFFRKSIKPNGKRVTNTVFIIYVHF